MVRGSDRPASSRPMKGAVKGAAFERAAPGKSAERDTGFRGRSATGDEGGGSFDTSPRPEGMRGSIHRGTTAGSRAGAGSSAGYQGTGVPTGRDRFAARATTSVKGAFGNKRPGSKGPPRDAGRGPPRGKGGGGKGGFRGGR